MIIPAELSGGETLAQALARHPERDVVIVDSSVRLDAERLQRLAACARREPAVATVSAFSNAGPVAYPLVAPEGELDALFARENAGVALEVPCALPPCVFIARHALTECGGLDAWDPGALIAFCARASEAGLRHVLCAEAYVAIGSAEARDRVAQWQAALENDARLSGPWRDFAQRAPATPPRRRVDLARLRASRRPRILFITHDWGGGVARHVQDLAALLADDCEVLALQPAIAGKTSLRWLRDGETLAAWFDTSTEWDACRGLLQSLGVARVHIHHVHGLPKEALDLASDLGVPYDITLHDHFPVCPQYHLADPSGRYCGEPDAAGCTACLAKRPAQWGLDIGAWRALFNRVLRDAARVIVPSADIAARIQRYFPDVQPQVWPHPEMRMETPRLHKVVILGGLSAIKGMDLFEGCVRDAMARELPLHFQVLGHTSRPLEVARDAPVAVLGSYSDARLASLVALEHPDAFLFLSQVPETYSYTLSVAMQTGKPIVATQIGAFIERLRGYPVAGLVAHDASPRAVNDALLRLVRPSAQPARTIAITAQRA